MAMLPETKAVLPQPATIGTALDLSAQRNQATIHRGTPCKTPAMDRQKPRRNVPEAPVLSLVFDNIAKMEELELGSMWNVFSKCKDTLENGRRLENLSWRLWYASCFDKQDHPQPVEVDHHLSDLSDPESGDWSDDDDATPQQPVQPQPTEEFLHSEVLDSETTATLPSRDESASAEPVKSGPFVVRQAPAGRYSQVATTNQTRRYSTSRLRQSPQLTPTNFQRILTTLLPMNLTSPALPVSAKHQQAANTASTSRRAQSFGGVTSPPVGLSPADVRPVAAPLQPIRSPGSARSPARSEASPTQRWSAPVPLTLPTERMEASNASLAAPQFDNKLVTTPTIFETESAVQSPERSAGGTSQLRTQSDGPAASTSKAQMRPALAGSRLRKSSDTKLPRVGSAKSVRISDSSVSRPRPTNDRVSSGSTVGSSSNSRASGLNAKRSADALTPAKVIVTPSQSLKGSTSSDQPSLTQSVNISSQSVTSPRDMPRAPPPTPQTVTPASIAVTRTPPSTPYTSKISVLSPMQRSKQAMPVAPLATEKKRNMFFFSSPHSHEDSDEPDSPASSKRSDRLAQRAQTQQRQLQYDDVDLDADDEDRETSSGWGSDYSTEEDESPSQADRRVEAIKAQEAEEERQRSMFAKRPTRSQVQLSQRGSGLLSQLFHISPDREDYGYAMRNRSALELSRRRSNISDSTPMARSPPHSNLRPPVSVRPPQVSKSAVALPAMSLTTSAAAELSEPPRRNPSRLRGPPKHVELEPESYDEAAHSSEEDHTERTAAIDAAIARHHSRNALREQATLAPPQTPRTTRRNMLAAELSESMRRNLLWERQIRNRAFGIAGPNGMGQRRSTQPQSQQAATATAQAPRRHEGFPAVGEPAEVRRAKTATGALTEYARADNQYFDNASFHQRGW
ncbi:hypothetical protein E5Q_05467 [Mixia osmundae IAM 14324]|uniref:Uncharacterized protein n=1 Tax=Mixia osmundae (strain CBS 9802 / IAM 14324 / JCM 22182 / KY 12970) TaxID=764103 RepID=G7E7G9_MIXOS|nr:hypothetical protein E5Q_05467 [Mixia osmundae IAM 14324]